MTAALVGDATKRRVFAANVDTLLAMLVALFAASRVPQVPDETAAAVAVAAYLAYFVLQEGIWSNTLGKRLFGLEIRRVGGQRCGWVAATIRTVTRVVEVNPILLAGLPAALTGAFSKRHQRIGDMLGGSVVVRRARSSSDREAVEQGDEADER